LFRRAEKIGICEKQKVRNGNRAAHKVGFADAGMSGVGGKAPEDRRTPRRFARAGAMAFAPAFWSAAALRRF